MFLIEFLITKKKNMFIGDRMKNNLFVSVILFCTINLAQLSGTINFGNKYATINLSMGSSFYNNSSSLIVNVTSEHDNWSYLLGNIITFSKGNLECENFEVGNSSILWQNAPNIVLHSNTTLSNTWYFSGTNKLNGNCHILDLSSNGNLILQPGAKLYINDIHIRGLGDSYNKGRIVFMDDDSQLWFCNASVELVNDVTTTIGGIYVNGPTTWIIKEHNWKFDQNASLTVDGVTLWKDPAGIVNYGDVKFGIGEEANYLALIESGTIKTLANLDILSSDTTYLLSISPLIYSFHHVFSPGYNTIGSQITWFKEGFTLPAGATLFIEDPIFIFGPIILNDTGILYLDDHLHFSSDLTFTSGGLIEGNGYTLILEGNTTLAGNKILRFIGDIIVDGLNNKFILDESAQIAIDNNVSVTLRNMTIKNLQDSTNKGLSLSEGSTLCLQNVKIELANNYTFTAGTIFFYNDVTISGSTSFIYQSAQNSFISEQTQLLFERGTKFIYDPQSTTNKNLIVMIDETSWLYLDAADLQSTATALQLTKGTLLLDSQVTISSSGPTISQAITFGDGINANNDLNIIILPGATLQVHGPLNYLNVT